jgi:hypothetical protein
VHHGGALGNVRAAERRSGAGKLPAHAAPKHVRRGLCKSLRRAGNRLFA